MNRAEAMEQLGKALGIGEGPQSMTELVQTLGGTRAVAELLPTSYNRKGEKVSIQNKQRTVQRYLLAEKGEKGERARGTNAKARASTLKQLRGAFTAEQVKQERPGGFTASVKGDFTVSETSQPGRAVKPVHIPADAMGKIAAHIQQGELEAAAVAFDAAYSTSYLNDSPTMSWGEQGRAEKTAYDELTIE